MGLIRKKPGQKIRILPRSFIKKFGEFKDNPAKIWVSVSLLFLTLSVVSWHVGNLDARAELNDRTSALQASADAQDAIGSSSSPSSLLWTNPICHGAKDPNMSVLCGQVTSAQLNYVSYSEDPDHVINYQFTGVPLENITVAVYEMIPESWSGKKEDGSLGHLFSATLTNKDGNYRITKRIRGPKSNKVYVAYLCPDGSIGDLKKVNSYYDIPNLNVHVNCTSGTKEILNPPFSLKYVDRAGTLSCITNYFEEASSWIPPLNFSGLSPKNKEEGASNITTLIESWIYEENYDPRYVSKDLMKDSLGISDSGLITQLIFNKIYNTRYPNTKGAYWAEDCLARKGKGEELYCTPSQVDNHEGVENAWLAYNVLDFIPTEAMQLAYRAKEIRFNTVSYNQDPTALYSFLRAVFGGIADTLLTKEPKSFAEWLRVDSILQPMPCEKLRKSKRFLQEGDYDVTNLNFSQSVGTGLSAPYSDKKALDALDSYSKNNIPVCNIEDESKFTDAELAKYGDSLSLGEILDPENNLAKDYYVWWLPLTVIFRESSVLTHSTGTDDSIAQTPVRREEFEVSKTEGKSPGKSGTEIVHFQGPNAQNSIAKLNAVTGKTDLTENYTAVLNAPYDEEEVGLGDSFSTSANPYLNEQVLVENVGAFTSRYCPVSGVYGDLLSKGILLEPDIPRWEEPEKFFDLLDVEFKGPIDHGTSVFSGSALYRTADARKRDQVYTGGGFLFDDWFDTLMRYAAEDEKMDFSKLTTRDYSSALLKAIKSFLMGTEEDKYFGDRDPSGASMFDRDAVVDYPLSAENFERIFPSYGESGYPGEHDNYPWHNVDPGQKCQVHGVIDTPNVNEIRTCKAECIRKIWSIHQFPDSTPVDIDRDGVTDYWKREDNVDCSEGGAGKEAACLLGEDTTNLEPPEPSGTAETTTIVVCDLYEAGPYNYIADLDVLLEGMIEQSDPNVTYSLEESIPSGGTYQTATYLTNSFKAPYESKIKAVNKAEYDIEYSGNESGGYKYGFDVPPNEGNGLWGVPDDMFRVASDPRRSYADDLNPIHYYCTDFDMEVDANAVVEQSGDWSCAFDDSCMPPPYIGGLPEWIDGERKSQCQVCNANSLVFNVPDNLKKMVEAAGSQYGVPGGMLLGIMYAEGSFGLYSPWEWTDENVLEWSKENAMMPMCDPCSVGAEGPAQFLKSSWEGLLSIIPEDAFGEDREPNRCNLADHLIVLAFHLQRAQNGNAGLPPVSCYDSIPYNHGSGGAASCGGWDSSDVVTASRVHRGLCDAQQQENVMSVWEWTNCN